MWKDQMDRRDVETLHATSLPAGDRYKGYRVESARLKGWDYSAEGLYFVTLCTKDRQPFFGAVREGEILLSAIGIIAGQYWLELGDHHPHAIAGDFVVMPNDVHGIVELTQPRAVTSGDRHQDVACNVSTGSAGMGAISPEAGSLGVVVRSYKATVSRWCRRNGYEDFAWQSRFHDHIIRDERSLQHIRQYILDNPARWPEDENYTDTR